MISFPHGDAKTIVGGLLIAADGRCVLFDQRTGIAHGPVWESQEDAATADALAWLATGESQLSHLTSAQWQAVREQVALGRKRSRDFYEQFCEIGGEG